MKMSFMAHAPHLTGAFFNQNPSAAKRQADEGPVVITERGVPSYVLLKVAELEAHWQEPQTLLEALRDPNARDDEPEFNPPRLSFKGRKVEF